MVLPPPGYWANFKELQELLEAYKLLHLFDAGKGSIGNFDSAAKLVREALQTQAARIAELYSRYGLLMRSGWATSLHKQESANLLKKLIPFAADFENHLGRIAKRIDDCKDAVENVEGNINRASSAKLRVAETAGDLMDALNAAHHLLRCETGFAIGMATPDPGMAAERRRDVADERTESAILRQITEAENHLMQIAKVGTADVAYGHLSAARGLIEESRAKLAVVETDLKCTFKDLGKALPGGEKRSIEKTVGDLKGLLPGISSDLKSIEKAKTFERFAAVAEGIAEGEVSRAEALAKALLEGIEELKHIPGFSV